VIDVAPILLEEAGLGCQRQQVRTTKVKVIWLSKWLSQW
jgi:hypothetical protein